MLQFPIVQKGDSNGTQTEHRRDSNGTQTEHTGGSLFKQNINETKRINIYAEYVNWYNSQFQNKASS